MNKLDNASAQHQFNDALKQTLEYIDNGNDPDIADAAKRLVLQTINNVLVAATDPDACCTMVFSYQAEPVRIFCVAVPPGEALHLLKEAFQHIVLELTPTKADGAAH